LQRLATRNREPAHDIAARLARIIPGFDAIQADLKIENTGSLAEASELFVTLLSQMFS